MEKQVEAFWNWFDKHKEDDTLTLIEEANREVKSISKGLFVEFNLQSEPKELIVTPHGVKQFFSTAYALVNDAPQIEGWKIVACKQPMESYDFKIGEISFNLSELTFMPLESAEYPDDLAVRIYHKDYVPEGGEQQSVVIEGIYRVLDNLLGEESTTFDFQFIDFDDMPHPKEKDYPLNTLPSFVAYKKAQRKNAGERFPKEDIILLEGKVESLPTLLVNNQGLKYYQFTKEFPFLLRVQLHLKNIGQNGLPEGNTDELYLVEDIIYKAIVKEQKGHFLVTETFKGKREIFYYVDSLETIESALGGLPEELTTCEISHTVDFDPMWVMTESYIYM